MSYKSFKQIMKENEMWIINEKGEVKFHHDYMMSESITPREIDFGTDFSNHEWRKLNYDFYVTYFKSNTDTTYVIFYREGFIGFGSYDDINTITCIEDILNDKTFSRTHSGTAIYIFNFVFYIILQALIKFKPNVIFFDGMNEQLKRTYDTITKNKYFLSELKKYGYNYVGLTEQDGRSFYTFKKEV